jgi:hypothetical protein
MLELWIVLYRKELTVIFLVEFCGSFPVSMCKEGIGETLKPNIINIIVQ